MIKFGHSNSIPLQPMCASHLTQPVELLYFISVNQMNFPLHVWMELFIRRTSRKDEEATGVTLQNLPDACVSESSLNLSHVYFNICARQGLYHLCSSRRFNERFPVATSELSDEDMMCRSAHR